MRNDDKNHKMKLIGFCGISIWSLFACAVSAAQPQTYNLKNDVACIELSTSPDTLVVKSLAGKEVLRTVGPLWEIRFMTGKSLLSSDFVSGEINVCQSNDELKLTFKKNYIEVEVKVTLDAKTGEIKFNSRVLSSHDDVISLSWPYQYLFPVEEDANVYIPSMFGLEFKSSWFGPIDEKAALFTGESVTVGQEGVKQFSNKVTIKPEGEYQREIVQTTEGIRWLGEKVKLRDTVSVSRPSVDRNHLPLFKVGDQTYVAAYPMGKGYYIRFGHGCVTGGNMDRAYKVFHPILKSILKKFYQKKQHDDSFVVAELCTVSASSGLDSCRNHLAKDLREIKEGNSAKAEVKLVRTWPDFEALLQRNIGFDAKVVVNYLNESFPCNDKAKSNEVINRIRKYIEDGGVWIDFAGGYPFYYAKMPQKWNPSHGLGYPDGGNGFSDFMHKSSSTNSFSMYAVQPIGMASFGQLAPDEYPIFSLFSVAPAKEYKSRAGIYCRRYEGFAKAGMWYRFPEVVVRLGGTLKDDYLAYGKALKIDIPLKAKLSHEKLDKWKKSLFVKMNDRDHSIKDWTQFIAKSPIKTPIIFFHSDWSHKDGAFDTYYPDYVPFDAKFGTWDDYKNFVKTAHEHGNMVMPYTNPILWDLRSEFFGDRKSPQIVMESFAIKTYRDDFVYFASKLTHMSQWPKQIMAVHRYNYDLFAKGAGVDMMYFDSVGAERYQMDFSGNAPYPTAHLWGELAMVNTFNKWGDTGIATENGGDQYINSFHMFAGLMQFVAPEIWGAHVPYVERFAGGTVNVFPFIHYLCHDKLLFLGYTTGSSVVSREMVSRWLSAGVELQILLKIHDTESKETMKWVDVLAQLQSALGPYYMGQPMKNCRFLADGVLETEYGDMKVVSNMRATPYKLENGTVIAPAGFWAKANTTEAGIIINAKGCDEWFITQDRHQKILDVPETYDYHDPMLPNIGK